MNAAPRASAQPESTRTSSENHEQEVLQAIRDTAFGTVEVVVHQSRVVQITRSEKVRFEKSQSDAR